MTWQNKTYTRSDISRLPQPNYWDLIAFCLVFGLIIMVGWGFKGMTAPYQAGQSIPISLDPTYLPYYALRTILRMFIALFFSLLFTFIFGTLAAKYTKAQRIIIPIIDILQSVPILGFLSIAVVGFIALFPGSILGPECAAIFAIFTSQVWNITLSFYQSIKTVPNDMKEAATMFHLSAWQRFWRIDVPFAVPGLLWNTMLSMSASWFFVVASEAISVANQNITLPGVGSYIALAVKQMNTSAIIYAIVAMFIVILLYDQLIFRPLVYWSEKFKTDENTDQRPTSTWLIDLFQRTRFISATRVIWGSCWDNFVTLKPLNRTSQPTLLNTKRKWALSSFNVLWNILITVTILITAYIIFNFVKTHITLHEVRHVIWLGFLTGIRVMVLIILCSLVWIPIGVWIGRRQRVAEIVQPIVQFLAAFPAYLLFPIVVMTIVKFHLNVEIWTSPLMVLGTQWYILFNVIAGALTLPKNLYQVTSNFGVTGWLWWRKLALPGIFPYFITGAMTAAGGAWNASIIAEAVSWGNTQLHATGLGAYIAQYTTVGDFPRIVLGITVMCVYVLITNRLVWRPLYQLAEERYKLD